MTLAGNARDFNFIAPASILQKHAFLKSNKTAAPRSCCAAVNVRSSRELVYDPFRQGWVPGPCGLLGCMLWIPGCAAQSLGSAVGRRNPWRSGSADLTATWCSRCGWQLLPASQHRTLRSLINWQGMYGKEMSLGWDTARTSWSILGSQRVSHFHLLQAMAGWCRDCNSCLLLKWGAMFLEGAQAYCWRFANGLPIDLFLNVVLAICLGRQH